MEEQYSNINLIYATITIILGVIIPLGGFLTWVYRRIDSKFSEMKIDMKEMKSEIISIDKRLLQLETRFEERGYIKLRSTGTEDKLGK